MTKSFDVVVAGGGGGGLRARCVLSAAFGRCYTRSLGARELRELLVRDPFESFRIRLSSGDSHVIRDRQSVALMRNRLFVALPNGEHWTFIPFLHIAAVESIRNGRTRRRSPRRPHD